MLMRLSRGLALVELWAAALLAVAVTGLILLNVVTRTAGLALFWVDELAIYAMVWMTFLGASAALHHRKQVSITLLTDVLEGRLRTLVVTVADIVTLVFAAMLLWFCWRWFAPAELAAAGFDVATFQGATFNFIYAEPTSTLGLPKYPFWLVVWLFAIGAFVHALAHLVADFTGAENPR